MFSGKKICTLVIWLLLTVVSFAHAANTLNAGVGSFIFKDSQRDPDKPITVWYYAPEQLKPNTPVLFVMHGNGRTAKKYRDTWIQYAEKYRFLLLTPEFSKKHYPSSREYHRGNVLSKTGKPIAEKYWTFTAIENIFDHVKSISIIKAKTYKIYGHSAGGQFVHRFVLLKPDARFEVAIAANAGAYTMPTDEYEFPYGLKNVDVSGETLKKAFKKRLIILLGDKDTDENHKDLPKSPGAMAQGKHRFIRGIKFFKTAKEKAGKLETSFRWQLKKVKNAGHSNTQMAKTAAKLLNKKNNKNTSVQSIKN